MWGNGTNPTVKGDSIMGLYVYDNTVFKKIRRLYQHILDHIEDNHIPYAKVRCF
jgi:hypothetical protein